MPNPPSIINHFGALVCDVIYCYAGLGQPTVRCWSTRLHLPSFRNPVLLVVNILSTDAILHDCFNGVRPTFLASQKWASSTIAAISMGERYERPISDRKVSRWGSGIDLLFRKRFLYAANVRTSWNNCYFLLACLSGIGIPILLQNVIYA